MKPARARSYETPLFWPHMPCGLHWPAWTDERVGFIDREYTAGTPCEIIDRCVLEMDGPAFTPDDLVAFIAARGLMRPPDWDAALAWEQWHESLDDSGSHDGGQGPFGVVGWTPRGRGER